VLGATAAAAVLNHIGPLSEVRGKWKNIKIINSYFDILTTFHPAFLLRKSAKKIIAKQDFLVLKKYI
jgi:uracil-DNA glycosylase family 4